MVRLSCFGILVALVGCGSPEVASVSTTSSSNDESGGSTNQSPSTSGGTVGSSSTSDVDNDPSESTSSADTSTTFSEPVTVGSSTASDTTGSGSTSDGSSRGSTEESSTGEPSAVCGDGVIHAEEYCDDGNANELDGCTSSCGWAPSHAGLGTLSESGLVGGRGEFVSDDSEECPVDHVLTGIRGELLSGPRIGSIAGICRPTEVTNTDPPTFVIAGPAVETPEHGASMGQEPWSTECDEGEAIVAIEGTVGSTINGLRVQCATVDTVGNGAPYTLSTNPEFFFEDVQGNPFGDIFGPTECSSGGLAVGLRARTSASLVQVGLLCRPAGLTYIIID